MFELISQLIENYHIDPVIMLLVYAAGMFQSTYLKELFPKVNSALKTLAISFIFFISYLFVQALAGTLKNDYLVNYFISYCITTSFYEIVMKKKKPAAPADEKKEPQTP